MRRSRVLIQTTTTCALVLSLAGCGTDNPKPAPAPSTTASASPTPTREVAPTMPAEAQGTSEAAAKAFVTHYLAVFSYATRTGDVEELGQLGVASCESCASVLKSVTDLYSAGGHATGRGYDATAVELQPKGHNKATVLATVIAYPQVVTASENATPRRSKREEVPTRFNLKLLAGSWAITDWTRVTQ